MFRSPSRVTRSSWQSGVVAFPPDRKESGGRCDLECGQSATITIHLSQRAWPLCEQLPGDSPDVHCVTETQLAALPSEVRQEFDTTAADNFELPLNLARSLNAAQALSLYPRRPILNSDLSQLQNDSRRRCHESDAVVIK